MTYKLTVLQGKVMRNKIFGAIGALWGGAVLFNGILGQPQQGASAYQAGQTGALIFGGLMLVVGLYYFFKKPKQKAVEAETE